MSDHPDLDFLEESLPAFLSEAAEQLASMEQLLLQLEDQPDNRELLDALFRCAHTVKGSAGIFGLTEVVGFTHHVETLLDQMREGVIALDEARSTLLLQCNDHIARLVDAVAHRQEVPEEHKQLEADLITELKSSVLATGVETVASALLTSEGSEAASQDPVQAAGDENVWHLSVAFGADCFRNGFDPLSIVRYLRTLGDVVSVACETDRVPTLSVLDPESCALTLLIRLRTTAGKEAIESAFSFVRDDCEFTLKPPHTTVKEWTRMIEDMADHPQIGQMLLAVGAITPEELHAGLQTQESAKTRGEPVPRLGEVLQAQTGVVPEVLEAAVQKQARVKDLAGNDEGRFIRVQASRLDAVINLLGELVIAGAGTEMLARQHGKGALIESSQHLGRLIEEIRNGTLQLRMVPIAETFSRFRRVVRDTSASLGKEVQLEFVGGETELDKSIVEKIADPLMHLVRNALDHGLESPAQRQASGKPVQGRLVLSAKHESGNILIAIEDDGRGIHRQKVLQRAWDRGLVEPGVVPADADILKLIFEPGFSTAEKITDLSGRGVGMDVVRRNIELLRGTVALQSVEGRGSRIEIRLPLTLAIIDGFLVSVGASRFVFPLESVVEVLENRATLEATDARGRGVIELRGEVLPLISLRGLFAIEGPAGKRPSVVVLHSGERRYAVVVDSLLGQHQTVIKPLGRMFRRLRGIAGSTILGNGEVALIFDVLSLADLAGSQPPTVLSRLVSVD